MAGFVEFFYNIIPGSLLLAALQITFPEFVTDFLQKLPYKSDSTTFTIFIILSLFTGFILQSINKSLSFLKSMPSNALNTLIKDISFNSKQYEKDDYFIKAIKKLKTQYKINASNENALHFMHNYLINNGSNNILDLFQTRISLWANVMTGSAIYFLVVLVTYLQSCDSIWINNKLITFGLCSAITTIFAYHATQQSQKILYDTVLKTFLIDTRKKG